MNNKHFPFRALSALVCCLMCVGVMSLRAQTQLYISGTTIDSAKVYDGTTNVSNVTIGTVTGLTEGTPVFISPEAEYLDANAGTHKPVVVTYTLLGPNQNLYLAPANDTLYADITTRPLYSGKVQIANNKTYDANSYCRIIDTGSFELPLTGDTVAQVVSAQYTTPNVGLLKIVTVTHQPVGPQASNYRIVDTNIYTANILKRPVTATGAQVRLIKQYDGSDNATVIRQAYAINLIANDDAQLVTTATYNDCEIGTGKAITLHYNITGASANNYITPADTLYSNEGIIIYPTTLDSTGFHYQQPIAALGQGFCQNTLAHLSYQIYTGEPTHYRLTFSENNTFIFNNTDWIPCTASDTLITFPVPSNCPAGEYDVTVTFYNTAMVESEPYNVHFIVNLPNTYIVQVFDDVVSIDNTELDIEGNGRFKSFQWYHNGTPIRNATLPYYRDPNGLSGEYSVMVNIAMADEAMVCPISHFTTVAQQPAVQVSPNPVINNARVTLKGFEQELHNLRIYSSYGVLMHSSTFSGDEVTLDLSTMPQGTYIINVDGTTAKTVKL